MRLAWIVVVLGLVACANEEEPRPEDDAHSAGGGGSGGDPGIGGSGAAPSFDRLTLVGSAVTPEIEATVQAFVDKEIVSNPTILSWFEGYGLRVRVLAEDESMTTVPEFVATAHLYGNPPEAYGLTMPGTYEGDYFLAAKQTHWFEITLAHELLHVVGFAGASTDLQQYMQEAWQGSTVVVEGSAANPHENFAYKGQYYLVGNGCILEQANDPLLGLATSLYPTPILLDIKPLADELLVAYEMVPCP